MPKLRGLLVNLSQAVDPIAITSLVKEMEATMPKLNGLLDKVSQSVDPIAITSLIKEMGHHFHYQVHVSIIVHYICPHDRFPLHLYYQAPHPVFPFELWWH